jgi:hypothetical protein
VYKRISMIALLALALTLAGCGGSGSGSGNINGTWTATLTNTDQSTAYSFSATFTQGSGSALRIANFMFTSAGPCFASEPTSETGTFSLSGNSNGNVTGAFGMTITTVFPINTNNVLTLQGTVGGSKISGTWTLTGETGCSGSGNFTVVS